MVDAGGLEALTFVAADGLSDRARASACKAIQRLAATPGTEQAVRRSKAARFLTTEVRPDAVLLNLALMLDPGFAPMYCRLAVTAVTGTASPAQHAGVFHCCVVVRGPHLPRPAHSACSSQLLPGWAAMCQAAPARGSLLPSRLPDPPVGSYKSGIGWFCGGLTALLRNQFCLIVGSRLPSAGKWDAAQP